MKKVIALLLALVVSLLLCACNSKNKDFVPAEDALPAVPELVGEWGSIYFAEESLMTICEDGSCTILRQPGTWGLHKDMLMWPKVVIIGQLNNKTEAYIEFYRDEYFASMDVYNKKDEISLHPVTQVVNRAEVVNPLDVVPFILGAWVDGENTEPFAAFYEDGTCDILGADGVWGLDYTAYYNEKYRNGWDYCLKAKIGEEEWDISISEEENGRYGFSIHNPQGGMSVIQTWEARNTNHTYSEVTTESNAETEPKCEVVEITLDNWRDYFEVRSYRGVYLNGFGEVQDIVTRNFLVNKDEFVPDFENSNVTIEYTWTYDKKPYSLNLEDRTIEFGETISTETRNSKVYDMWDWSIYIPEYDMIHSSSEEVVFVYTGLGEEIVKYGDRIGEIVDGDSVEGTTFMIGNFEMTRVIGNFCFTRKQS